MATYVTVHRPARDDEEGIQTSGPYHDMMGEVVGFSQDGQFGRVLVALEDGTLVTFAPSELRAGKVTYTKRSE